MNGGAAFRPIYVPCAAEPVLGVLHEPTGRPSGTAVLMVPPFGWEDVCSYRARREWADRLAADGHPTLRFDLPATGDSGGSPEDAGLLEAWADAVSCSAAWLAEATGARRVVAIGIALGGLLACRAIAAGAPIDDLVLWGTPARGKALVREIRAFARLGASRAAGEGSFAAPPLPEGALEANGYLLSAETAGALEAADLTALPVPDGARRKVLFLERDGLDPDARLLGHLRDAGADVTVEPGNGFGAMMAEPQLSRPPIETFATVSAWLASTAGDGDGDGDGAHAGEPEPEPEPAAGAPTLELSVDGAPVRETPITFGDAGNRLFGVLAEPVAEPVPGVCVVFLNAGAIRRSGPNRMWVEAARRWAGRGVPSLRLDLEGLGDADGDASCYLATRALYDLQLVDQVRSALDALQERSPYERFVLVGLCSGAFWAFHGAQRDERVQAAFMLNPSVLIWDDWVQTVRESRKLRSGTPYRKLITGQASLRSLRRFTRALVRRIALAPFRVFTAASERRRLRRAGGDELDLALDRLRDAGKRAVIMFTSHEVLYEELQEDGHLARLDRWPNLRLELLASPPETHTLQPVWLQNEVHALLDRALVDEIGREERAAALDGLPAALVEPGD